MYPPSTGKSGCGGGLNAVSQSYPLQIPGWVFRVDKTQAERALGTFWEALGTSVRVKSSEREAGRERTPLHLFWSSLCLSRPALPPVCSTLSSLYVGKVQTVRLWSKALPTGKPSASEGILAFPENSFQGPPGTFGGSMG